MRVAAIDIGTNTILMLIADIEADGALIVLTDEHCIARLGKGVDENGLIQPETFHRVKDILANYKSIANKYNVQKLIAVGTSAIRDAKNNKIFISYIKKELFIDIKILSGEEEAKFTYLGAISNNFSNPANEEYAVIDIGGGSTEIVTGIGSKISSFISVDIGSVRLTERILKNSPPDIKALENAILVIQENIKNVEPISQKANLIGVAGTMTTLAALELRLKQFDRVKVNRHMLNLNIIESMFNELKICTLSQLKDYPQIHPLRADILLAGILILKEILKKMNRSNILVSDRGLRYGLIMEPFI